MPSGARATQDTAGAAAGATGATQQSAAGGGHTFETRRDIHSGDVDAHEILRATGARTFDTNSKALGEVNLATVGDWGRLGNLHVRMAEELFSFRMAERERLAAIRDTALENLVDEQKRLMGQESRHHDLAVDRQWNPDEQVYGIVRILNDMAKAGNIDTSILASVAKTAELMASRLTEKG